MDYKLYQNYIDARDTESSSRSQLRKVKEQLSELEKQLAEHETTTKESLSLISPDNLITAVSVKLINQLLSGGCSLQIGASECPVSFVQLVSDSEVTRLEAVLSQPLFHGWRTETPYVSYQLCPLSVVTPTPPSENHIPEYTSVLGWHMNLSCWEYTGDSVILYCRDGDNRVVFALKSTKNKNLVGGIDNNTY